VRHQNLVWQCGCGCINAVAWTTCPLCNVTPGFPPPLFRPCAHGVGPQCGLCAKQRQTHAAATSNASIPAAQAVAAQRRAQSSGVAARSGAGVQHIAFAATSAVQNAIQDSRTGRAPSAARTATAAAAVQAAAGGGSSATVSKSDAIKAATQGVLSEALQSAGALPSPGQPQPQPRRAAAGSSGGAAAAKAEAEADFYAALETAVNSPAVMRSVSRMALAATEPIGGDGTATTGAADSEAAHKAVSSFRMICQDEAEVRKAATKMPPGDAQLHEQFKKITQLHQPRAMAAPKGSVVMGEDGATVSLTPKDKAFYFRKVESVITYESFKSDTNSSIGSEMRKYKAKWLRGADQAKALASCVHYARVYHAHETFFRGCDEHWQSTMARGVPSAQRTQMFKTHWQVINVVLTHYKFTMQLADGPAIFMAHWTAKLEAQAALCDLSHLKIPKRLNDINAEDQRSMLDAYQVMIDSKGEKNGARNVQFNKQLLGIRHLNANQLAQLTRKVAERNTAMQLSAKQKNG
jgi:sulfur relay (sulfurtransferase) DsrC/TusE family protein